MTFAFDISYFYLSLRFICVTGAATLACVSGSNLLSELIGTASYLTANLFTGFGSALNAPKSFETEILDTCGLRLADIVGWRLAHLVGVAL